jgi:hypothetical protein
VHRHYQGKVSFILHLFLGQTNLNSACDKLNSASPKSQIVLLDLVTTFLPHGIQQIKSALKACQRTIWQSQAAILWNTIFNVGSAH